MPKNKEYKMTAIELFNFSDYVSDFYHQDKGIYPIRGANKGMINVAISKYLRDITYHPYWTWGGGDSKDRERTRDILECITERYSDHVKLEKKEPEIIKII